MLLSFDDDDTDDPAMEADSHVMAVQQPAAALILCLSMHPSPIGIVLVRMSTRIFLYLSLTDSAVRIGLKDTSFQTLSLCSRKQSEARSFFTIGLGSSP